MESLGRIRNPVFVNGAGLAVVATVGLILVLWAGWGLLRGTTHVLMEGSPRSLDPEMVRDAILSVDCVGDVHHLHLWNLASDIAALSAHVVVTGEPTLRDAQGTARQVKEVLAEQFEITNVTLELEGPPLPDFTAQSGTTGK